MTPRDLLARLRLRPFIPFRMVLPGGHFQEVRDPDLVKVGSDTATVGPPGRESLVSLPHVIRLEPLPSMYRPVKPS